MKLELGGGLNRDMKLNQHLLGESGNRLGGMEDQDEDRKASRTLSVIQRLDRLDQVIHVLEERHGLSARHPDDLVVRKVEPRDECKSISSALEEVHHKGTVVERLAMLEDRVLQLSLEIDAANTSKSSSSGALLTEKIGKDELSSNAAVREEDQEAAATNPWENKSSSPLKTQVRLDCVPKPKGRTEGKRSLLRRREWLGCFQS